MITFHRSPLVKLGARDRSPRAWSLATTGQDRRLPIPGRAPWSGFGRWGGGGVPLNPGHRMGSPALPDCGEALGLARTN
jgi:hypothetical protein